MKNDLFFFCKNCSMHPKEDLADDKCGLDYSIRKFHKGDYIAYQGDRVNHLYLLSAGKVRAQMVSDSGVILEIEELNAPCPLAAPFLFADNNKFPVDVIAQTDCEILFITKASVEKQMMGCVDFMRGFLAFNANRLQYLSERLKIFAQKTIKAKLAYYILQREKNGEFILGRNIATLAAYFAVERPSLSRAISEWIHEGIIEMKSGKGRILNPNALKDYLIQ